MLLKYQKIGTIKRYGFLREEYNAFQGLKNENNTEAILEVEYLYDIEEKPCFRVSISNYKQSNAKGLFRWVGDLHELRNEVLFSLNKQGQIDTVLNQSHINQNWNRIKKEVKNNHQGEKYAEMLFSGVEDLLKDNKRFSSSLRFAMPYLLLFSGINNKDLSDTESINGYREMPNFLNTKTLPIITEEKLILSDLKKYEVEVTGKVDTENFEQDKITSMITILKNRPRVPTLVELNYFEKYTLDENHWPTQAMCMSMAFIPGTLIREEKTIIKEI